jgi:hypothetical protein
MPSRCLPTPALARPTDIIPPRVALLSSQLQAIRSTPQQDSHAVMAAKAAIHVHRATRSVGDKILHLQRRFENSIRHVLGDPSWMAACAAMTVGGARPATHEKADASRDFVSPSPATPTDVVPLEFPPHPPLSSRCSSPGPISPNAQSMVMVFPHDHEVEPGTSKQVN